MSAIAEVLAYLKLYTIPGNRNAVHSRAAQRIATELASLVAKAELAARGPERVVEVIDDRGHSCRLSCGGVTLTLTRAQTLALFRLPLEVGARLAVTRLPFAPKPDRVAVWQGPVAYLPACSQCGMPILNSQLGKLCPSPECGKLLAETATPWPKEAHDG